MSKGSRKLWRATLCHLGLHIYTWQWYRWTRPGRMVPCAGHPYCMCCGQNGYQGSGDYGHRLGQRWWIQPSRPAWCFPWAR